jgi:predicted ester cyclase
VAHPAATISRATRPTWVGVSEAVASESGWRAAPRIQVRAERTSVIRSASAAELLPPPMIDHRETIRAFYDEIWNRHDKSMIPALLHERFSFRGSLGQVRHGHAGFADYVDFIHAALGDYRCDIEEIISEGNRAFARMRFSGIHRGEFFGYAPTSRRVQWAGAAVFGFDGDRISDLWVLGDVHGLLEQLASNAGA